jgi:hypothetical protein
LVVRSLERDRGGVPDVVIVSTGMSWDGGVRCLSAGVVVGDGVATGEEAPLPFLLVRRKREEKLLWSIVVGRSRSRQRRADLLSGATSALMGGMVLVWW